MSSKTDRFLAQID